MDLVGSYEQIRSEIKDIEIPFRDKKKQVVWRGAVKTNKQREQLIKITKNKEWADVKGIAWKNADTLKDGEENNAISTPNHCLYQFVLQTEGESIISPQKPSIDSCFRSQLFWQREIPTQLQLNCHNPQTKMDSAIPRSP